MSFQKFVDKAIANRKKFLEPYRKKFEAARTRRKKAEIVVELLKVDPSHINEMWIRREFERWLLDPYYRDYFDKIKPPTEKQQINRIRDAMIFRRIEDLRKSGLSGRKACQVIALEVYERKQYCGIDLKSENIELDEKIYNIWKAERKRRAKELKPYYGRDIRVKPRG